MTLCYLSPLWQVSSGHLKTLVTVSPHRFLDKFWQAWLRRLDKSRTAGGVFKGAGFGEGPVPEDTVDVGVACSPPHCRIQHRDSSKKAYNSVDPSLKLDG